MSHEEDADALGLHLGHTGETIVGRPSIAEFEKQVLALFEELDNLPYNRDVPRSGPRVYDPERTAAWVQNHLAARVIALGLGSSAEQTDWFLFGPGWVERLCLVSEPTEFLAPLQQLDARVLRAEFKKLVGASAGTALRNQWSKRTHELVPSGEAPAEVRGRVALGWGAPYRDGQSKPGGRTPRRRRQVASDGEDEEEEEGDPGG